jgi:predicted TIM-barrel fold metal-dependent hydrolase
MYMDRLEYMMRHSSQGVSDWMDPEYSPVDVLKRNFWFCTIDDPSMMGLLDRIGEDRIMFEVDYPHADSSWPHTQAVLTDLFKDVSDDKIRKITYENASQLFRHPLPEGFGT